MVTVLDGCITLSQDELESIAEHVKEHAILHGFVIRTHDHPNSSECVEYFPFTLFPSIVPRSALNQVRNIQPYFSRLLHKVSHDKEFLYSCFKNVLKVDGFIRELWNIFCTVHTEGLAQPVSFGLFRNDYMMEMKNKDNFQMKQIEFNTIACANAGLISRLHYTHRYSLSQARKAFDDTQLPENNCVQAFASGIHRAWQVYDNESNEKEVAVVYFRTGYSPDHYKGAKDWNVRLLIERSLAIKCPPVHYQLAGSKRVQMELTRPGAVERYIPDPNITDRIRATFVEQFSLDLGISGDKAVCKALEHPDDYIMKPNREGGGNNIYGDDIQTVLNGIKDSPERAGYILMERIHPWPQKNCLLKVDQDIAVRDVISEIGIYAVYIGSEKDEIANCDAGYLLRSKDKETNEGSALIGLSYLDTPFLVD